MKYACPHSTVMTFLLLAVLTGMACTRQPAADPRRASVSGIVMLGDTPLPGGSITFLSKQDANYRMTGMIQADGSFSFDGAPVGTVEAAVETDSLRYADPAHYVPIPPQYSNLATSGLTYDLHQGDNPGVRVELQKR